MSNPTPTGLAIVALATTILCGGCQTLAGLGRVALPGVTLADGEYRGVARGCLPIGGTLLSLAGSTDPRIAQAAPVLTFLGIEPLGCLLVVEPKVEQRVGVTAEEVRPYFVHCSTSDRAMYEKCATLPLNQQVLVVGQPLGPPPAPIRPSRIVRDE